MIGDERGDSVCDVKVQVDPARHFEELFLVLMDVSYEMYMLSIWHLKSAQAFSISLDDHVKFSRGQ